MSLQLTKSSNKLMIASLPIKTINTNETIMSLPLIKSINKLMIASSPIKTINTNETI